MTYTVFLRVIQFHNMAQTKAQCSAAARKAAGTRKRNAAAKTTARGRSEWVGA